jgi:septum formation protein
LVTFNLLTLDQIEYYVENYKPYDKAGGYAIQEWIGVVGIQSIQGDFYNVMGLPVSKLLQKIKQLEEA